MRESQGLGVMLRSYIDQAAPPIGTEEAIERSASAVRRFPTVGMSKFRRSAPVAAAVAMVLVSVVIVSHSLSTAPVAAGVVITEEGGVVTILFTDPLADPEEVGEVLRAAGIDVTIREVPVSPSEVGFLVSSFSTPGAPELELISGDGPRLIGFRVQPGVGGLLELHFGRPPVDGEGYDSGGVAYWPGEPLACALIWGLRVDEAVRTIAELQLDVEIRWQILNDDGSGMIEVPAAKIGSLYVTDAHSSGPSEVLIYASVTPESLFGRQPPDQTHCTE